MTTEGLRGGQAADAFAVAVEKIKEEQKTKRVETAERLLREALELDNKQKEIRNAFHKAEADYEKNLGKVLNQIENLTGKSRETEEPTEENPTTE